MIIIPRVLIDLAREVDEDLAGPLALDLAELCLDSTPGVLPPELDEASRSYLAAARNHLKSGDSTGLGPAHSRFFDARENLNSVSSEVSWVARLAVNVSCQREMERLKIIARDSYVPTVVDVIREAQKAVGQMAAGGSQDPQVARRARWEHARRQLVLLIESVPFPESLADEKGRQG